MSVGGGMAGLGGREGETSQALLSQPPHPESAFQPLSPLLHRPQPGALSHLRNSRASSERLSKLGHLSVTAKANEPQRADSWALHSGLMDASSPVSSPPSGLGPAGRNSSISERKLPTTRERSAGLHRGHSTILHFLMKGKRLPCCARRAACSV